MEHIYQQGKKEAPVLVLLHGTGGDERSLLPLVPHLNKEATVLSVRGEVNEGGALRFFKRKAEGIYDIEDLYAQGEKLAAFIKEASEQYDFSMEKVVLVGFSNGSNIAINLLLEHSNDFKKGILFAPLYPLDSQTEKLEETRVFLSFGKFDPICPVEQSHHVRDLFEKRGAKAEQVWVNTHEITMPSLESAAQWLQEQMA